MSRLKRSQNAAHHASSTSCMSTSNSSKDSLRKGMPILGHRQGAPQQQDHAILLLFGVRLEPDGRQMPESNSRAETSISHAMRKVRRAVKQRLQVHRLPDRPRLDRVALQDIS
jgi:hypothetical protein